MHQSTTSMPVLPRRLDKYLRDSLGLSRSDCERAWELEKITTSSNLDHLGGFVFPEDAVFFNGQRIELRVPETTVMFHKPAQVVTTLREPSGRRCVGDWLEQMPPRVFPMGRLDSATTGLLLLSDDGDLAHMLMHPDHGVTKAYVLEVVGRVAQVDPRLLSMTEGIELDDGPARSLSATVVTATDKSSLIEVEMDEGRNRIVRRMAKRAGLRLLHLHRTRVGPQNLGNLDVGTWRTLSPLEVEGLWEAVGGREAVYASQMGALRRRADYHRSEGRPFERLEAWLQRQESI